MKISILGAGISGITIASMLIDMGIDADIYEKEIDLGGLARSVKINDFTFDLHGGHVFNSKNNEIKNWVFSKLPQNKWEFSKRNARILYRSKIINYPFELSLYDLEADDATECILDLFESGKGDEPLNFHDWLIWKFGKKIADDYLIPYNAKIWAYPLKEMETGWINKKIPLSTKKEILSSLISKDPGEIAMPHSTFYYPQEGGINELARSIAANIKIRTNDPVLSLEKVNNKWIVNGKNSYDAVISTIPLPDLGNIFKNIPHEIGRSIQDLKHNSITTILCETEKNDISWLYIPSNKCRAHRIVYQGNLSSKCCPEGKGSCAVEVIGKCDEENILNEFKQDEFKDKIKIKNIFQRSFTPFAYTVFDKNYSKNINIVTEYFKGSSLYLLGRFGEWKFYNIDGCIESAFRIFNAISGHSRPAGV